jgi:hypothetical protein
MKRMLLQNRTKCKEGGSNEKLRPTEIRTLSRFVFEMSYVVVIPEYQCDNYFEAGILELTGEALCVRFQMPKLLYDSLDNGLSILRIGLCSLQATK